MNHNAFCVLPYRKLFVTQVMESLHINGHSIKFVDRKLMRRDSFESKLNLSQKLFVPFSLDVNEVEERNDESDVKGRKCPKVIEVKAHKRKILKRPRKFKNYYTDRQPLSIPRFSFPRYTSFLHFVRK
jgi:hypothetical protein